MIRVARTAHRLRWWLLVVGLMFELAGIAWVFFQFGLFYTPLYVPPAEDAAYIANAAIVVGLLLLAQWCFLRPGKLLAIRLTTRGRPLKPAVFIAAAMAMLLTLGVVSLVFELFDAWEPLISPTDHGPNTWPMTGIWAGMLGVWMIWAALFFRYWKDGDRYTQLGRMVRALIAGSLLEAVVATPVQAFAEHPDDCYCASGSYTTLVCAGAVLFWAFSPGIVLLFMRESYRRMRLFPHCPTCGYDLRGGPEVCPECGSKAPTNVQPTV